MFHRFALKVGWGPYVRDVAVDIGYVDGKGSPRHGGNESSGIDGLRPQLKKVMRLSRRTVYWAVITIIARLSMRYSCIQSKKESFLFVQA